MEDEQFDGTPLSCVLSYLNARVAATGREKAELEASYLSRKQRLMQFHERQRSELAELRRCMEYINEHALVIEAALRSAMGAGGAGGRVPLTAALVQDIAAMRNKMQQSINNAIHIRSILGQKHRPLMDELLRKMETELNNWSVFLNGATRALLNSDALLQNVHNLILSQQKMCAQVASSGLLLPQDDESPPREQPATQLTSTPLLDQQH